MTANNAIIGMLLLFGVLVVLSVYRRRESVAQKLRQAFISISVFVLTFLVFKQITHDSKTALIVAIFAELIVIQRTRPRRTRYVSRMEKRKVVERFERQTGQRYNSKKHHIDHVVPYSRGGGNRADNLRIRTKEENLAKSAKSPWWDVFG